MSPRRKANPCPDCGEDRVQFFGDDRSRPDGLGFYCLGCKRKRHVASNAKRRHKIRAWEEAHAPDCLDCGRRTAFNGKKASLRCDECAKAHKRAEVVAKTQRALDLRRAGLLNHQIADALGCSTGSVARLLSRPFLREYGLLDEREVSPYYARSAA